MAKFESPLTGFTRHITSPISEQPADQRNGRHTTSPHTSVKNPNRYQAVAPMPQPRSSSLHAARQPMVSQHPPQVPQLKHRPHSPNFAINSTPERLSRRDHYRTSNNGHESDSYSEDHNFTLPPLQTIGPKPGDAPEPLDEDDPRSFDLVEAGYDDAATGRYALELRADQIFSREHLQAIFDESRHLLKFTGFLNTYRPQSIPVLVYYLDAVKALRAIAYANAVSEALLPVTGHEYTQQQPEPTRNSLLEQKVKDAFDDMVRDDLPAYIAHTWVQVVSQSIRSRVCGTMAPHLREASEGLAEVFCLTDPSRPDNPIVFASEEFTRTTQYGLQYVIGRNCRFLQGPKTSPDSVRRLAAANRNCKEHLELIFNYRRDGTPFMNLLMTAPLMDSKGNIRYFIGAQVDVSGLARDCVSLDSLWSILEKQANPSASVEETQGPPKNEFQELTEMFNGTELDTVKKHGGQMHKEFVDDSDRESIRQRRIVIHDSAPDGPDRSDERSFNGVSADVSDKVNGKLQGIYQHYLLVRPAPSLRILFTSPSLRVPGMLQSPFLNRIGGSARVRADLFAALEEGRGVTAKIRWLTKGSEHGDGEGRPRWIHCTPLVGHSGAVGVWMIVLIDDDASTGPTNPTGRRFKSAPPVAPTINGKASAHSSLRDQNRAAANADHHRPAANAYDDVDELRHDPAEMFPNIDFMFPFRDR